MTIPDEVCKMRTNGQRIIALQQPKTGVGVVSDQTTLGRPVSTIDPFSRAFLRDAYPRREALREAGQAVARLETEAVLSVLARRVASFEFTGEPGQRLNNTLRGFDTLPLRIIPI